METKSRRMLAGYILVALFVLYCLAELFDISPWTDILSLANVLIDGVLLWLCSRKARLMNAYYLPYLLVSAGLLSWAGGDLGWLIIDLSGGDAGSNQVLWIAYAWTNVLLATALLVVWRRMFTQWNPVQLIADILSVTILTALSLWILFFHKDAVNITRMAQMDFTSLPSIVLDVLIGVGIFQWIVSIRSGKIPRSMLVIILCTILFATVDIAYYYILYWDIPIASSVTDILYIASFNGMVLGVLWVFWPMMSSLPLPVISNIGLRRRWPLLLLFPGFILVMRLVGVIPIPVLLQDYALILLLIFLHWVVSRYIQLSIENERLLRLEKQNTATLEKRVAEQVEALAFLSNQDNLTSLRNRRYFLEALEASMKADE